MNSAYAKVVAFAETGEVACSKKKNKNVLVFIDLKSFHTVPQFCLFKNSSGPSVIRDDVLEPSWESLIQTREMPDLYRGNNSGPRISETFMLQLSVDDARSVAGFDWYKCYQRIHKVDLP